MDSILQGSQGCKHDQTVLRNWDALAAAKGECVRKSTRERKNGLHQMRHTYTEFSKYCTQSRSLHSASEFGNGIIRNSRPENASDGGKSM